MCSMRGARPLPLHSMFVSRGSAPPSATLLCGAWPPPPPTNAARGSAPLHLQHHCAGLGPLHQQHRCAGLGPSPPPTPLRGAWPSRSPTLLHGARPLSITNGIARSLVPSTPNSVARGSPPLRPCLCGAWPPPSPTLSRGARPPPSPTIYVGLGPLHHKSLCGAQPPTFQTLSFGAAPLPSSTLLSLMRRSHNLTNNNLFAHPTLTLVILGRVAPLAKSQKQKSGGNTPHQSLPQSISTSSTNYPTLSTISTFLVLSTLTLLLQHNCPYPHKPPS